MLKKLWWVYCLLLIAYSIFSYALTDPNLVISSQPWYWNFQQWMWRTFFDQASTLSWSYGLLITAVCSFYGYWLFQLYRRQVTLKPIHLAYVLVPLLFSYNALSHDVFNYMFNAKMVTLYQANPHVKVALDFLQDDWLRFMHNTHTPAPYGYGWTAVSLVPSLLGLGKFLPTWLGFRALSLISWGLLYVTLKQTAISLKLPQIPLRLAVVFLNPLMLIEIISNSHNDLWMMVPAVAALALVATKRSTSTQNLMQIGLSLLLLGASVSIKFASLTLIPVWLFLVFYQFRPTFKALHVYWPLLASVLMFIPLVTARSQQFHPWYLTWVLVWLPLFQTGSLKPLNLLQRGWSFWVVALSISSLYRYLPWLITGGFADNVLNHQKLITWSLGLGLAVIGWWGVAATRSLSRNTLQ
jgi:hypothetical protein